MDHHVIAHIDPNVCNSFHVRPHGAMEENQIAGADIFRIDFFAHRMQSGRTAPSGIVNTGMNEHPADKAGAVESLAGIGRAVNIRITDILVRFHHERGEVRISHQKFIRNRVFLQLILGLYAVQLDVLSSDGSDRMKRNQFSAAVVSIEIDQNVIHRKDLIRFIAFSQRA